MLLSRKLRLPLALWVSLSCLGIGGRSAAAQVIAPTAVDLNADGLTDIIFWEPSDSTWRGFVTNPYQSDFTTDLTQVLHGTPPTDSQILTGDLRGNNSGTDVFTWRKTDHTWVINFPEQDSSGDFSFTSETWPGVAGADGPFYVGDLNGDGRTDVVMWDNSAHSWLVYLSTGSAFSVQRWTGAWGSDGPIFIADLNGDHKADVFMWRDSTKSWTINISTGTGFRQEEWRGAWGSDGPIHVGDLNGDGKADVFMWRDSSKTWTVNLSSGHSFEQEEWHGTWGSDGPNFVGDFDGNGITDVAVFRVSDGAWFLNWSTKKDFISRQMAAPPLKGPALVGKFFNKRKDTIAAQDPQSGSFTLYTLEGENQTWPVPRPNIVGFSYPSYTPYDQSAKLSYTVTPSAGCSSTVTGGLYIGANFSNAGTFTVSDGTGQVNTPPLKNNPTFVDISFACVDYGPARSALAYLNVGAKPPPPPQPTPQTGGVSGSYKFDCILDGFCSASVTFSGTTTAATGVGLGSFQQVNSAQNILGEGSIGFSATNLRFGTWTIQALPSGVCPECTLVTCTLEITPTSSPLIILDTNVDNANCKRN